MEIYIYVCVCACIHRHIYMYKKRETLIEKYGINEETDRVRNENYF